MAVHFPKWGCGRLPSHSLCPCVLLPCPSYSISAHTCFMAALLCVMAHCKSVWSLWRVSFSEGRPVSHRFKCPRYLLGRDGWRLPTLKAVWWLISSSLCSLTHSSALSLLRERLLKASSVAWKGWICTKEHWLICFSLGLQHAHG